MTLGAPGSGAVTPLPGSAAAVMAWRARGQLHLTVIVKATFAFVPGAAMTRVKPQEILRAEVHHGKNPGRSARFTADLAPYLHYTDVLFTGHACAPPPASVQSLPVRLAVTDGDELLLDKALLVQDKGGFQRMPMVYERALCGAPEQENPFGVGADGGPGEPNILDPAEPERPAGFGPIARAWPARKRLLGATPRKALEGPIAEIPDAFDWGYFQASPPDQRIDILRGDEWILLDGLHPTLPRLKTRLPGARGLARIYGLSALGVDEGHPLELRADTLRIDGDEQCCTVVWRQILPIPSEAALARVRVVAGVELLGEETAWPGPPSSPRPEAADEPTAHQGPAGTMVLSGAPDAPQAPAAPETAARAFEEDATVSLSPAGEMHRLDEPTAELKLTLALSEEAEELAQRQPTIPFHPVSPVATLALSPADEAHASGEAPLPFPAPIQTGPLPVSRAPIAGAPWSGQGAPPIPAPSAGLATMALADDITEPQTFAPADPVVALPARAVVAPSSNAVVAPPALPSPPEPFPSRSDDADAMGLERCAAIAAELAERRAPRPEVLKAHGLTEARWAEADRRWRDAIDEEEKRGGHALRDAYDAAHIGAWESLRGSLQPADYARLVFADERGDLASALDAIGVRRTVWLRLKRLWARRIAEDPSLAVRVKNALAALRVP